MAVKDEGSFAATSIPKSRVNWSALAALLVSCLAALILHQATAAAPVLATAMSPLVAQCETLTTNDLSGVADAPTHLTSAKVVSATPALPTYCDVEGNIAPQVGIRMWLPTQRWNGKFLEVGCGGFCGSTDYILHCQDPLLKGYACITTDMGHKGKEAEGAEWAYNNLQAVVDFSYRATHVTALAGKAIIENYYGRKPKKSYFEGCSTGGRQALVEAERFPWDFNGIIVGAPAISYTDILLSFARRARLLHSIDGKPLFDANTLQFLNKSVVAKCDLNDGLKDGQIGDPRLCRFNPHDYECKAGAHSDCLTHQQADAAAAYYTEQRSASGDRVGDRAHFPGSELSYVGMTESPIMKPAFYEDFFKYMGLVPNPGPNWKMADFNINTDYKRLGVIQSLLAADNPDFSDFNAAGGKLIFYHGWGDGGPSPQTSIDFYKKIERTMGGRAATQEFLRLFMIPDMDHCAGGKGPWSVDYLGYLEKWVEQGQAPDMMIGAHYSDDPMAHMVPNLAGTTPLQFTRPIFQYPRRAQYRGTGDPNSASSFEAVNSDN